MLVTAWYAESTRSPTTRWRRGVPGSIGGSMRKSLRAKIHLVKAYDSLAMVSMRMLSGSRRYFVLDVVMSDHSLVTGGTETNLEYME